MLLKSPGVLPACSAGAAASMKFGVAAWVRDSALAVEAI
jgi:hypothetical protein